MVMTRNSSLFYFSKRSCNQLKAREQPSAAAASIVGTTGHGLLSKNRLHRENIKDIVTLALIHNTGSAVLKPI